jgi:ribose transport system substrate-binding protein
MTLLDRRRTHSFGAISALLTALLAMPLAGCHRGAMRVAVIPQTTAYTTWEAEHAGAEFAAAREGFRVYWNAPTSEDDIQQQAALIERVVNEKYPAMILAPDQAVALMAPVQRALEKGVRTVIVVSPLTLPPGANLTYIVNDDAASGRIAAMRMGKILSGHGRIAILGVPPESLSALAIVHAFETTLEERFPGIVIADRRFGSHNETEAQQIADEVLATDPKLDGLFTVSSAASGGAFAALHSRGLARKVRLIGFEQSVELANLVRQGEIDSLVAINTYEMGYKAMQSLAEPPGSGPREVKLEPTLLTADNLDLPSAKALINVDWSHEP